MLDGAPGRYARPYDSDAIRIGKDAADHGMLGRRAVALQLQLARWLVHTQKVSCRPPGNFGNSVNDVGIGAATDVAAHALPKLCWCQLWRRDEVRSDMAGYACLDLVQHSNGGTYLTRRAITALIAVVFYKGGLHCVHLFRRAKATGNLDPTGPEVVTSGCAAYLALHRPRSTHAACPATRGCTK
jgi:hypothetical protein